MRALAMQREAFFLGRGTGRRFCLVTRPEGCPVGGIIHVPAFAEELNTSRRMIGLAARSFARAGWVVLQMDLHGCGDSAGDFGEAHWDSWLEDLDRAWAWMDADCAGPRVLWSLRAGALLVADWLKGTERSVPLLFWQPVTQGQRQLNEFLRLRAMAGMLEGGEASGVVESLRLALETGEGVEVAGYSLGPALAAGLSAAELVLPEGFQAPVGLLEVAAGGVPGRGVQRLAQAWRALEVPVWVSAVDGPRFWQSREIMVAPALCDGSLNFLKSLEAVR
ncbi:hydrolase 2, exosortase A system-associated [Ectothiorhodospira shaposhnikovii]|uniref:hydrolase 2, exosortase A system-associated n=1 Tax=Ectothiorhodospira shaposhnikovii TaxID=1054 RepID=UPI0039A2B719